MTSRLEEHGGAHTFREVVRLELAADSHLARITRKICRLNDRCQRNKKGVKLHLLYNSQSQSRCESSLSQIPTVGSDMGMG